MEKLSTYLNSILNVSKLKIYMTYPLYSITFHRKAYYSFLCHSFDISLKIISKWRLIDLWTIESMKRPLVTFWNLDAPSTLSHDSNCSNPQSYVNTYILSWKIYRMLQSNGTSMYHSSVACSFEICESYTQTNEGNLAHYNTK